MNVPSLRRLMALLRSSSRGLISTARSWNWPKIWTALLRAGIGAGILLALLGILFILPQLLYPPLSDNSLDAAHIAGKDRIQLQNDRLRLQNDARATLLQGLGGAVLLLGAIFTWQQLQTAREGQIT